MKNHTCCLICSSDNFQPMGDYYIRHGLVKCYNCGFVFMEKVPTEEELQINYGNYTYSNEQVVPIPTIKRYHELLDEFEVFRKNNRILDVGCGRGWFLSVAKERGWEVYGTEFSPTAVQLCESHGISMHSGALKSTMFQKGYFDIVTSFEVIEHVNNPNEDMEKITNFLRKGGLFYCTTPNFNALQRFYFKADYAIIEFPEHLSYYTKATLLNLTRRHGFKPLRFISSGFSPARIKKALRNSGGTVNASTFPDADLRKQMETKWYLRMLKKIANGLFTLTNTGETLKGYFVKV